jgi:hypothetical protein
MEKKNGAYTTKYREGPPITTTDDLMAYGRELGLRILAWDREDIQDLKGLLDEASEVLKALTRDYHEIIDYETIGIDMLHLPSYSLPEQFRHLSGSYPVWAIDANGRALVGEGSDSIKQFWVREREGDLDEMAVVSISDTEKNHARLALVHDEVRKDSGGAWDDDRFVYSWKDRSYTVSRWTPPSARPAPEPEEFTVAGYETVERRVEQYETFGLVLVPASWIGKRVVAVRLDP